MIRRRRRPRSIPLPRGAPRGVMLVMVLLAIVVALSRQHGGDKGSSIRHVPPPTDPDVDRYHDKSFRVVRVVDGDTLDIDAPDSDAPRTRVRLWGVDAPGIGRGDQPDMHYGPQATQFARETLQDRMVHVALSPRNTRDRYGRLLAYVFLERGGVMFNELLIERGFAYADPRFAHHYKAHFRDIEQQARRAGVGLWKDVTVEKMPAWRQRLEREERGAYGLPSRRRADGPPYYSVTPRLMGGMGKQQLARVLEYR